MYVKKSISRIALLMLVTVFVIGVNISFGQSTEFTDRQLTMGIQGQLLSDQKVASHLIDVDTDNGIVTLSGTVDHLLAKDRAVKLAQSTSGVRAVIDQLDVKPVMRTDEQIKEDINQALMQDPATEEFEVDVTINDGVVTLSGEVESWGEKHLVSQVVKSVKGIKELNNNITLDFVANRTDIEIQAEIRRQLELDPYVSADMIDIQVNDGDVTLSGFVGSVAARSRVFADAWVSSVRSVDDSAVEVRPERTKAGTEEAQMSSYRTDEEIAKAVELALQYDPRVSTADVHIAVEDQKLRLSGTVQSLRAKNAAEEDARNTIGVWRVKNYLVVRSGPAYTNEQLEQYVQNVLRWDPVVDQEQITARVLNEKVFLNGEVDTYYEKQRAQEIVSNVKGVANVHNALVVNSDWEWKSDKAIREDIESEFLWNTFIDQENLRVSVKQARAIIGGKVEGWNEVMQIVQNAFEGGAKAVQVEVDVEGMPFKYSLYYPDLSAYYFAPSSKMS